MSSLLEAPRNTSAQPIENKMSPCGIKANFKDFWVTTFEM